jgi:hypothetical protein
MGNSRMANNRTCSCVLWLTISLALAGCGSGGGGGSKASLALSQQAILFGNSIGSPTNPAPVSVNVTNTGSGTLSFTATSDSPWLSVTPGSGDAPQSLQVSAALGTLATGSYTGHVSVTDASASGSPAIVTVTFVVAPAPSNAAFWGQWGANPQHTGMVPTVGQNVAHQLADIFYEPFVKQEQAETKGATGDGELTVHYQVPITDGNDVYIMIKAGTYNSCSPAGSWSTGSACGPNT